jgi:hypothetical protein
MDDADEGSWVLEGEMPDPRLHVALCVSGGLAAVEGWCVTAPLLFPVQDDGQRGALMMHEHDALVVCCSTNIPRGNESAN